MAGFTSEGYVLTDKGFTKEVTRGALVLTADNTYKEVKNTLERKYHGTICKIRPMSSFDIECTSDLEFYARRRAKLGTYTVYNRPEWVKAEDLTKEYFIGMAINQKQELPQWRGTAIGNKTQRTLKLHKWNFWYLVGRYVATGVRNFQERTITISSIVEKHILHCTLDDLGYNYTETSRAITIKDKELCEFLARYGFNDKPRKIDNTTINLPEHLLEGFITGLLSGGYKKDGLRKIQVPNKRMAYALVQCIGKAYKRPVSIKEGYCVIWQIDPSVDDLAFYEDGYMWCHIRALESGIQKCEVMEIPSSYTINGYIVK